MDIDPHTLPWLAGLFEGEASFMRGTPSCPTKPLITITMTDEDVIARVANIFNHSYTPYNPHKTGWNITYKVTLKGASAVSVMRQLRPLMGKRRQQQIDRALEGFVCKSNTTITTPKLSEDQVREIKRRLKTGETARSIAKDFPVTHFTIWGISEGKTWKHVTLEPLPENLLPSKNEILDYTWTEETRFSWLIGLLEAEGSFMPGTPSEPNRPRIVVAMTDEDIVARAAEICGVKYCKLSPRSEKHKDVYRVMVRGYQAIELLKRVYPLMGIRRQKQIKRVIDSYKGTTSNQGESNPSAKITEAQAREIKIRLANNEKISDIATALNISLSIIREIKYGRTWKHLKA